MYGPIIVKYVGPTRKFPYSRWRVQCKDIKKKYPAKWYPAQISKLGTRLDVRRVVQIYVDEVLGGGQIEEILPVIVAYIADVFEPHEVHPTEYTALKSAE